MCGNRTDTKRENGQMTDEQEIFDPMPLIQIKYGQAKLFGQVIKEV